MYYRQGKNFEVDKAWKRDGRLYVTIRGRNFIANEQL